MNMLSTATKTMSSREIAAITMKAHFNVVNDIKKMMSELEIDVLGFQGIYIDAQNRQQVEYLLDKELTTTLITGYSIKLRHEVIKRWQELEGKQPETQLAIPQNFAQAMRLAADLYEQNEQLAIQRDHAIATKAHISDAKTAKAMNTASQAVKRANKLQAELGRCVENATIIAVKNLTGTEYAWQPLRKWCKAQGVKAVEVVDARFGLVKSWPSAAWAAVYSVTLEYLFAA